jgi:hypothetical protein
MQVPIRKIVSQYLNSADRSDHEFVRLYNIAVRGCENEFQLDIQGTFLTVLLDVEPNKTVQLPVGYVNYSKVGIVNQVGEFVCLKRNDQLSNYHAIYYTQANRNAGVPSINNFSNPFLPVGSTGYAYSYWYNFWQLGTSFNLYGLPSGTATIGTYKIDIGANVIILNPDFTYPQVLLEYLSDGYNEEDTDYMIDSRCAEAMLSWIRWQGSIDQPKKFSPSLVAMYERQFYNQKRLARMRMNPFNLAEMNDIIRRSSNLTAKA